MPETYREIEHSGDIGIEAFGKSLEELFCNAALGLFGLVARGEIEPLVERPIRIDSSGLEDLLVDWLSEIISLAGLHGEIYGEAHVKGMGEYFLEGSIRGEKIDPARHDLRFEVKAATYHDVYLRKEKDGYRARVIFDL